MLQNAQSDKTDLLASTYFLIKNVKYVLVPGIVEAPPEDLPKHNLLIIWLCFTNVALSLIHI